MERLTKDDLNKVCYDPWEICGMDKHCTKGCHEEGGCTGGCHILKMHMKLAEYEDAEENGMLIHLPCKAGSKVYKIVDDCNFGADCYTRRMCNSCEYRDLHIEPLILVSEYDVVLRMKEFGKTVFLTREAAEQTLAKMGE